MLKKLKSILCIILTLVMVLGTSVFVSADNVEIKKIRVDVSETDWENVNIHYWGGISSSSWPGCHMEKEEGADSIYSYEIPADSTGIIFNSDSSGVMKQTIDITDIRDDVLYHIQKVSEVDEQGKLKKANVTMTDKNGNEVNPEEPKVDTMPIYFDNNNTNWDSVSIHYWGSGVTGTEWPGKVMSKVADRSNIYVLDVPVGITGIVFTNSEDPDNIKSSDVTDIPSKEDYEADKNISAEYISTGYEYGKYVVLRKDDNGNTYLPPTNPTSEQKTAKQVNVHVGTDYSKVYLSYTTIGEIESSVLVTDSTGKAKEYTGTCVYSPSAQKYKHSIEITELNPSITYTYIIGKDDYSFTGTFKSLSSSNSEEVCKFAYLADTQVASKSDAKVVNATFNYLNNYKDLGFIYIGGDLTDNSDSKEQWEGLFESNGIYKTGGKDSLSNNLLAVAQGNHDKSNKTSTLSGYITAPNEGGDLVYAFDYGKVKFIVLNLETAKNDDEEREKQKRYLEEKVAEAKKEDKWTIVGFHKSIYTGASHIIDSDVVAARKYWSPILAKLDVDVVLQAHDHVLARGFINGDGTRGNVEQDETGAYKHRDNSPLYMVGGHAGGLKWYSAKEYLVGEGDPLLPNYEFLDLDSALGQNGTDKTHETMYTIFEVSNKELITKTYAFKYDTDTDTMVKAPYLYDSITVKRNTKEQSEKEEKPKEPNNNLNKDEENKKEENKDVENNNQTQMAKTGDNNKLDILIIALMISGLVIITLMIRNKKNKSNC